MGYLWYLEIILYGFWGFYQGTNMGAGSPEASATAHTLFQRFFCVRPTTLEGAPSHPVDSHNSSRFLFVPSHLEDIFNTYNCKCIFENFEFKGATTLLLRICQERIMHIWMVKMAYKHAQKRKSNLCGEDKRKRKREQSSQQLLPF
jgi:hypothetical protein